MQSLRYNRIRRVDVWAIVQVEAFVVTSLCSYAMIVALQSRVPLVKITDERTRLCCDVSMENDLSLFKVEILFKTTSLEDVEH